MRKKPHEKPIHISAVSRREMCRMTEMSKEVAICAVQSRESRALDKDQFRVHLPSFVLSVPPPYRYDTRVRDEG